MTREEVIALWGQPEPEMGPVPADGNYSRMAYPQVVLHFSAEKLTNAEKTREIKLQMPTLTQPESLPRSTRRLPKICIKPNPMPRIICTPKIRFWMNLPR
jgi:hypothetical protein